MKRFYLLWLKLCHSQSNIVFVCNITGHLHIQRSVHSSVRLRFRDDLSLDWDGRGRVLLKVKAFRMWHVQRTWGNGHQHQRLALPLPQLGPRWAGQTCGLCGNYNGNQGDDFLSGSGLVEAGPQAFSQSWRINGDCENGHKHDADPCAINPKRGRATNGIENTHRI